MLIRQTAQLPRWLLDLAGTSCVGRTESAVMIADQGPEDEIQVSRTLMNIHGWLLELLEQVTVSNSGWL